MNKLRIKMLSLLLVVAVISGILAPARVTEAAVSSKSFTVTLDKKTMGMLFKVKSKKTGVLVDIKILKITGKAKASSYNNGKILWVGYENLNFGKGSLFEKLAPKDFKKGAVLTSEMSIDKGTTEVDFYLPDGVKKMKLKITFRTEDKSKNIVKIKKI